MRTCRGSLVFYVLKLRSNCKNVNFVFRFLGSLGSETEIEGVPMEATVGFCGSWAVKFTASCSKFAGVDAWQIQLLIWPYHRPIHFLMLNNLYD